MSISMLHFVLVHNLHLGFSCCKLIRTLYALRLAAATLRPLHTIRTLLSESTILAGLKHACRQRTLIYLTSAIDSNTKRVLTACAHTVPSAAVRWDSCCLVVLLLPWKAWLAGACT